MKQFFANPWTKRGFSLLSVPYALFLGYLAYLSVFYTIVVEHKLKCALLVSLGCILFLAVMFYTRKQVVTTLVSTITMPFLLPIVALNLGEWELLVPLLLLSVAMFFLCGANESVKTILATIFLLIYILGGLAYFLFTNVFASSIQSRIAESGVSLSGDYRYEVVYTIDKSEGSTYVSVEPNTYDKEFPIFKAIAKGYADTVYLQRPMQEMQVSWKTETRAEITSELLAVNPDVTFTLNEAEMKLIDLDKNHRETIDVDDLSTAQREMLDIVLESDFGKNDVIPEGTVFYTEDTITLDIAKMHEIGWIISQEIRLDALTDLQLETLGVPDEGDVLLVGDKVVFRYYLAVLERTFSVANREILFS